MADQYLVFLSYSSIDSNEARSLAAQLEEKRIGVFLAEKDLQGGDEFEDKIRAALLSSDEVCILVTPNSTKSDWVRTEIGAAWALQKRITPVIFRTSPAELPGRLRDRQAIDLHRFGDFVSEVLVRVRAKPVTNVAVTSSTSQPPRQPRTLPEPISTPSVLGRGMQARVSATVDQPVSIKSPIASVRSSGSTPTPDAWVPTRNPRDPHAGDIVNLELSIPLLHQTRFPIKLLCIVTRTQSGSADGTAIQQWLDITHGTMATITFRATYQGDHKVRWLLNGRDLVAALDFSVLPATA